MPHPKDFIYIKVSFAMEAFRPSALLCTPRVAHSSLDSFPQRPPSAIQLDFETMPVLRKLPTGHTVRSRNPFFHISDANEEVRSQGSLMRAIISILRDPTRRS